jgi:hypothetical protein
MMRRTDVCGRVVVGNPDADKPYSFGGVHSSPGEYVPVTEIKPSDPTACSSSLVQGQTSVAKPHDNDVHSLIPSPGIYHEKGTTPRYKATCQSCA